MTTTTAAAAGGRARTRSIVGTARITGAWYLALGVTGMLGFLLVRPQLYVGDDPAATLANLVAREGLARWGVALEMGIVVTQTMVALWFYRLFRSVDAFAAGAIAVFGVMNAVAILVSAAALGTALQAANEPSGDAAANVQLMYAMSENLWGVGAIFFGLWLVPMGWCVLRSAWLPRALGWVLVAGGAGYVLSAFSNYLLPGSSLVSGLLTVPATIGEFWIIGCLLLRASRARPETADGRIEVQRSRS